MTGVAFFDLDGVVRVWDPEIMASAERAAGLPAGSLATTAFEPALLHRAITGVISDEVWRAEITAALEARFGPTAGLAVAMWSEPVGDVDADVLAIVREVRRARPVALLSNATSRLPADLAALHLLGEFDVVVNSSELGVAKPDPRVFVRAADIMDAEIASCWFVDDSLSNVRAATAAGLRAHHFLDAAGLAAWARTPCPAG